MLLIYHAEVEIPELKLRGYTMFVETSEHEAWWTVACENRAIVTVPQEKLLLSKNYSEGRGFTANEMRELFERRGLTPC